MSNNYIQLKSFCFTGVGGVSKKIDNRKMYLVPYTFEKCNFCEQNYRTKPVGWQGNGQRGQCTGWMEDPVHPGACCDLHYVL
jgi:hypothetical protein